MEKVIICKDVEGTLPGLVFRAIRDIEVGEELTIPYYYADDFVSWILFSSKPF